MDFASLKFGMGSASFAHVFCGCLVLDAAQVQNRKVHLKFRCKRNKGDMLQHSESKPCVLRVADINVVFVDVAFQCQVRLPSTTPLRATKMMSIFQRSHCRKYSILIAEATLTGANNGTPSRTHGDRGIPWAAGAANVTASFVSQNGSCLNLREGLSVRKTYIRLTRDREDRPLRFEF